jgi:two-component system OmpR family response regulator
MAVKVLVMDDEADTLNMLAMTLRLSGYDVATAETGKKAISLTESYKPDIIVLDVMMPDITGIEVLRQLKKNLPKAPPAIFLSASIKASDQADGMAAGAFTYLVKPVLRVKLIETIKAALAAEAAKS